MSYGSALEIMRLYGGLSFAVILVTYGYNLLGQWIGTSGTGTGTGIGIGTDISALRSYWSPTGKPSRAVDRYVRNRNRDRYRIGTDISALRSYWSPPDTTSSGSG